MEPKESLHDRELIYQLNLSSPQQRIDLLQSLERVQQPTTELTHAVERTALADQDPEVKEAAFNLLLLPQYQLSQRMSSSSPEETRRQITIEIENWERDRLISEFQARLLRGRMGYEPIQKQQAIVEEIPVPEGVTWEAGLSSFAGKAGTTAAGEQAKIRSASIQPFSISKLLFSETSIKVALFLGAFFVLAAAIILMALVEVARLPILGVATLGFFGGALGLKHRLPLASIVLFFVGTALVPIDAAVIASLVEISFEGFFWPVVTLITSSILTMGFFWYESRLLSILGYLGFVLSVNMLSDRWSLDTGWALSLQLLLACSGLAVSYRVFLWRGRRLFSPLFIVIQVVMLGILLTLAATFLAMRIESPRYSSDSWLLSTLIGVAGLANLFSDWLQRQVKLNFPLFALPVVACLAIFPLALIEAFQPSVTAVLTLACGWGLALTGLGEYLYYRPKPMGRIYAILLFLAGVFLAGLSAFVQAFENVHIAAGYLAIIAGLYIYLAIRRTRWIFWSLGLLSAYLAYLTAFQFPALARLDLFLGFIQLAPALVLLALGLTFYRSGHVWELWLPPVALGALTGSAAVLFSLALGFGEARSAGWSFLILAIFIGLVSLVFKWPLLAAGTTLSLTLSMFYILQPWDKSGWLLPLAGLGALYYLAGRALQLGERSWPWSRTLCLSGLILAVLLAFTQIAFFQPGAYLVFLLLAVSLWWETLTMEQAWSGYLSLAVLAASLGFLLFERNVIFEYTGWYFIGLGCGYCLSGWLLRQFQPVRPWSSVLRASGVVLLFLTGTFYSLTFYPLIFSVAYGLLANFLALESLMRPRPSLTYLAAASLALSLTFLMVEPEPEPLLVPLGLALVYYGGGLALTRLPRFKPWGEPLILSGLGLGMVASFLTMAYLDMAVSLRGVLVALVALVGACFAYQGVRKSNFWLSYPACALFYLAYLLALTSEEATWPQFYSVGAALLGIALHYIALRNDRRIAALITGVSAQLILLGTTYIQLVDAEQILFFYLGFFQSLVLLIYGLLARSRSFVGIPVFFATLTVVTVTFSLLKGLSTAILIGGTGLALLFLGTISLLLRERVVQLADRFGQHLINW